MHIRGARDTFYEGFQHDFRGRSSIRVWDCSEILERERERESGVLSWVCEK